jgi:hypothetical protein
VLNTSLTFFIMSPLIAYRRFFIGDKVLRTTHELEITFWSSI